MSTAPEPAARPRSRRRFLGGAAAGIAGLTAAGATGFGLADATDLGPTGTRPRGGVRAEVPLYGPHQPGIATPAQDRLAFAAFDLTTTDRAAVQIMLGLWAAAAQQLVRGRPVGGDPAPEAPPPDTGEALDLAPAGLTVTVGFGPSFFDERLGLAGRRPAALAELPPFAGDRLQPARSGGDLCVQACSDDPVVAFHVLRNFARSARGTAVLRWTQLGFGRTSTTSRTEDTPRNLMGFKDGTNNIRGVDAPAMDAHVWVGTETDQPWLAGGCYLVARRIRMLLESWDADSLADQERVFGRAKTSGAPLTGRGEFDPVRLDARKPDGTPVIDPHAHIRLAAPATNGGLRILRRGYSYTDGVDPDTGLLDAGLFFLAYQQDPRRQFVPLQQRLATRDNLNEYLRHTGSAVFAMPPGLSGPGDWFGRQLLR